MSERPDVDEQMMRRSIELAVAARRAGNTPVGCVIALDGEIIAEAEEEVPAGDDPFAHAEIIAVRRAVGAIDRKALEGATLYTTNEPCFLCSYAIRHARIGRVSYAIATKHIGGASSEYPILTAKTVPAWGLPPQVESGLLADEYRRRATAAAGGE